MSLLTCHYCVDTLHLLLFFLQRKIGSNERGTFLYQRCTSHACSGDIAQIKIHNQITYAAFLCRWIINAKSNDETADHSKKNVFVPLSYENWNGCKYQYAFHRLLKTVYLDGKQNHRLGRLLSVILKIIMK